MPLERMWDMSGRIPILIFIIKRSMCYCFTRKVRIIFLYQIFESESTYFEWRFFFQNNFTRKTNRKNIQFFWISKLKVCEAFKQYLEHLKNVIGNYWILEKQTWMWLSIKADVTWEHVSPEINDRITLKSSLFSRS